MTPVFTISRCASSSSTRSMCPSGSRSWRRIRKSSLSSATRRDDEPRRDLDAAADLDGAPRMLPLAAYENVRQHVVAGDDARHRLSDHPCLLEDVAQQLFVLPAFVHRIQCSRSDACFVDA